MPTPETSGNQFSSYKKWLILGFSVLLVLFWQAPPLRILHGAEIMPLWLHTFAETFSIVVAMLIFGVGWNAYNKDRSGNIIILACAFLAVGLIDFAHTISYNGMPDFITPAGREKGINFWLAGRLLAALALLVVAVRPWQPFSNPAWRYVLLAGSLAITALIYWLGLFHPSLWPRTFIEGQGLTPFKITVEYAVIAILIVPAGLFYRQARKTHANEASYLFVAASIFILSELCFTLYSDVRDAMNLLGHAYKVVACMFLYRAIFVSSVREPFQKLNEEIAGRKIMEEALRRSEVKLRTLFDSTSDAVMLLDEKGFLDCNNATLVLFGCATKEAFCLKTPAGLSPPEQPCGTDSVTLAKQQIAMAMEKGRNFFEWVHKRVATGEAFHADVLLNRMELDGKMVLQATVRDITWRKKVETELQIHRDNLESLVVARTSQLEVANKELESFSYSVSHDLRAPLRSIDGFSEILEKRYAERLDDSGRDYLGRVRRASKRMGELIDDLLLLARVTRAELHKETVDLSRMVQIMAREIQEAAPQRQVEWIIQDGILAQADSRLIKVVLENLLGNAWKFTAHQSVPRIEFGMIEREDEEVIFMRDNGAGFDMQYAGKLFGAFQRLHKVDEFEGTGIGLATVQRIIQRHGGRVWAEGQTGTGATFYFVV